MVPMYHVLKLSKLSKHIIQFMLNLHEIFCPKFENFEINFAKSS